jgi:Protein kinase domain/PEGA domain
MAANRKIATLDLTLPVADAAAFAEEDPHLGAVLGDQYRIEERMGSGGMGAVYRARQLSIDRPVAVKLIAWAVEKSPEHMQRFRREAEALAKLRHPNTVHMLDFGVTEDGRLFMVMELLSGDTLEQRLFERGKLEPAEALSAVRQIAQSISEAHALGIVHRDLKPSNVFMSQVEGGDSFVKVMDFGVAGFQHDELHSTLTVKGAVLGTAAYMSPEQAQGFEVDARADLYSLGAMLFEMLTGRTPFQANSAISLLLAQVSETPPRLADVSSGLPQLERLQRLLDKLLAKNPNQRPSSATEVIAQIDEMILELGEVVSGSACVAARKSRPPARPTHKGSVLLTAALCALLLGTAGWLAKQYRPADYARFETQARSLIGKTALVDLAALQLNAEQLGKPLVDGTRSALDRFQRTAAVTIASMPSGATVKLNGAELGKTPYPLMLKRATVIEVELDGHAAKTVRVDPGGEPNVVVTLDPLPPYRTTAP